MPPDFNKVVQEAGGPPRTSCDTSNSSSPTNQDDKRKLWEQAGFKNPRFESWSDSVLYADSSKTPKTFTHGIALTAVVFRNAGWTVDEIKSRFVRLAEVYSQCGIKIRQVDVVESDAPNGWIDLDGRSNGDGNGNDKESHIVQALPIADRPVFFYFRSARDATLAYSQPEYWTGKSSLVLDTVWMTLGLIKNEKNHTSGFSTEAHELGHTLGNRGHDESGKKNFLAGSYALLNDVITKDQCDAMKRYKSVRPL